MTSNAGAFLSLLDVSKIELTQAIEKVFNSYNKIRESDQVLIQPMLTNVLRSGVVFSHDPSTCAPYRIINWSEGNKTDEITGGLGGDLWVQAACSPIMPPAHLTSIFDLVEEVLEIYNGNPVDCEFCVTSERNNEILWLLQARPLY